MSDSTNDFIGLFSVAGVTVSIAIPYIVVPDAFNHAIKVLLSPLTNVVTDLSNDLLSDAKDTARELKEIAVPKQSWLGWFASGGKRTKKLRR